ncbi:MAG: sulfite exporter TauE/SafE family protein [Geminicoccales bacterium]
MTAPELSVLVVATICGAFLLAGTVKGTIGAGLPLASIPIVALVVEPATAVSLTIVPVIVTNVWQALHGGRYREVLRRFWPFLACLIAGVIAGAQFLATADPQVTKIVLGAIVAAVSLIQLVGGGSFTVPKRLRPWLDPLTGAASGVFGGMAGMMVPAILYAAALRLSKDVLISLFALVALCGTIPLYVILFANGALRWPELLVSAAAMLPAFVGLVLGTKIRGRISQRLFERCLFTGLIVIGLNLIRKGLM